MAQVFMLSMSMYFECRVSMSQHKFFHNTYRLSTHIESNQDLGKWRQIRCQNDDENLRVTMHYSTSGSGVWFNQDWLNKIFSIHRFICWHSLGAQKKFPFCSNIDSNHWIIHLFNIIEILNKFKIFQYHQIRKFSNIIDLRKVDFLSAEKISDCSRFVNKDISKS